MRLRMGDLKCDDCGRIIDAYGGADFYTCDDCTEYRCPDCMATKRDADEHGLRGRCYICERLDHDTT